MPCSEIGKSDARSFHRVSSPAAVFVQAAGVVIELTEKPAENVVMGPERFSERMEESLLA